MRRPIICITPAYTEDPGPSYMIRREYADAVISAGGIPLLMPYAAREDMQSYVDLADGFIFSGGGDILSSVYGEEAILDPVNYWKIRDDFDLEFFRLVYATDLPIIAICRGMQVANVALGGTLWQDLPTQCNVKRSHRQTEPRDTLVHTVTTSPDSLIREITGLEEMGVNTYHHQAIKDVAPGLRPTAYSDDGIIEAAESTDRKAFFLATQWHPEGCLRHDHHRRIFERFILEARNRD